MSKLLTTSFFTLSLLLFFFFTSTDSARPAPATSLPSSTSAATKAQFEAETEAGEMDDQSCQGLGKEDCLERRSLAAHLDYIYTQGHNKQPKP